MIRQAIRTGEFLPGQQLSETGLAQWCGVSRTPVREALTRLQHEGLIVRTEHGPMVHARSFEEIYNIFEVRVVLEEKAARAAAERRTDRDLFVLRAAVAQYERAVLAPDPKVVASAVNFHQAIWKAARNETLFDLLMQLDMQIPRYPNSAMSSAEVRDRSCAHHRDLLAAIEAGDADRAAAVAAAHFVEERDIRLKYFSDIEDMAPSADA
jgi:DNA-binding GntR family transcriptional regulator